MDQDRVPVLPAGVHVHEAAEEDAAAVDDGDAGHERAAASAPHVAVGPARARAPGLRDAVQAQDGGDGAGRPAPSQLQDQPEGERRAAGERELRLADPVAGGVQGHRGGRVHRRTLEERGSIHTGTASLRNIYIACLQTTRRRFSRMFHVI